MTTNEAAERLRKMWGMGPVRVALLDDALAAERRATVERIRVSLRHWQSVGRLAGEDKDGMTPLSRIHAILDEEAAQ